jgi:4-hydroxy-3-methylbut-2-enyl diphosphate reductase
VHNLFTVSRLEALGAIFVNEIDEVPAGGVVVISAHGAAPSVHADARNRGLVTVDATCPLVSKIYNEARRLVAHGYHIVYIGQTNHDEVVGVQATAPESFTVVANATDVSNLRISDGAHVAWLSQTTLSVDTVTEMAGQIRERFPDAEAPPSDDICYAAQNRQNAVRAISARVDLVLVVGSAHSHNSRELVKVALAAGAPAAQLVDNVREVDAGWLSGLSTIGLTGGASVPEILVQEVLDWLIARGFSDVEEVETGRESMRFAPPRGLLQLASLDSDPTAPTQS